MHVIILEYCNILICNNFWYFHVWPVSRTMRVHPQWVAYGGTHFPCMHWVKEEEALSFYRCISARAIQNKPIKEFSIFQHLVRYSQLWFIFCQQCHWEIRRFTTSFCCFTTLVVLRRCLRCVKNSLRVALKGNQYNSCDQICDQQLWSK